MKKKKIRIGFDMDGVLLYNPLRTLRVVAKALKQFKPMIVHQKRNPFFIPRTPLEKFVWSLLHRSSLWIDPAVKDIVALAKEEKIEAYIISGRYQFLGNDYLRWAKKLNQEKIFKETLYNKNNMQPNMFKQKMIEDLKLDIFVEDSWDIVEKLRHKTKAKIFWISNILDFHFYHPYKYKNLTQAIKYLKEKVV